ncbi:MAG: class I SAM-dependent methyltransferase [Planctomycetota bacterium]
MEAAAYETFARNEREHFWFVGRRAIFFDVIRRRVGRPAPDAVALDLGCGVGGMLGPLSEFGRVVGMDIDPGSLAFCRERGFPHVFRGFGDHLPLADASVDLIGAFDVLEHIPEELETIAECYRVLKPGGWFFLSGPAYQFLYTHQDRMVHHQRRYTTGQLRRKFRAAGFEIERASYVNFFLFPLIFCVLMVKKVQERLRPPRDDETRFNTDVRMPRWLNALFTGIFSAERFVLRAIDVPVGHSVILLARKPGGEEDGEAR